MSFVSNRIELRTYDPETGWELVRDRSRGPDHPGFCLKHPTQGEFKFWGKRGVRNTGGLLPDGALEAEVSWLIMDIEGHPNDAPQIRKDLITAALTAHGMIHNGPVGPTNVKFISE